MVTCGPSRVCCCLRRRPHNTQRMHITRERGGGGAACQEPQERPFGAFRTNASQNGVYSGLIAGERGQRPIVTCNRRGREWEGASKRAAPRKRQQRTNPDRHDRRRMIQRRGLPPWTAPVTHSAPPPPPKGQCTHAPPPGAWRAGLLLKGGGGPRDPPPVVLSF